MEDLALVVSYLSSKLQLPPDEDQASKSGKWYTQFQRPSVPKVPVIPSIQRLIKHEWRDPERILVPRCLGRLHPLTKGERDVPQVLTLDLLLTNLTEKPSLLSEGITLQDPEDKKVEAALKRAYAGLGSVKP
ncbi:hypothetical protein NDU88_007526 [Pleurodeles waltl]|uniref:Uncharacterized protein n=1 Tax=Pleurodeles waltl TaxID=8319 RepID=A0AAV7PU98_PLEWA|nr:hypothetical protein NDU88_007526 [Pleurodeles waltl]